MKSVGALAPALAGGSLAWAQLPPVPQPLFFDISLAQWSFHKALFSNQMQCLDFPVKTREWFGISRVEYVNQFFKDKAKDTTFLKALMARCNDNGVTNHLIMIDGEGALGDADAAKRTQAIENHYKWVEAAKFLGCSSIRVNAFGEGEAAELSKRCADGLSKLCAFAATMQMNVIVENHGGLSSNGKWLAGLMRQINLPNCGTLPDFGNFCLEWEPGKAYQVCKEAYDPYLGVAEMMPFAKGVSAKAFDFDANGNETTLDYDRLLRVVKAANFTGTVGIEFEGKTLGEEQGVRQTLALLKKVGAQLG